MSPIQAEFQVGYPWLDIKGVVNMVSPSPQIHSTLINSPGYVHNRGMVHRLHQINRNGNGYIANSNAAKICSGGCTGGHTHRSIDGGRCSCGNRYACRHGYPVAGDNALGVGHH
ncbi:MAG: hypothetical protein DDT29_00941 [Dehalococcoidia bacterium]|nr:hypothetical protein [Bacillota bacterium]